MPRCPALTPRPLPAGSPRVPAQRWEAATYTYMLPECFHFQIATLTQRHAEKSPETLLPGFKRKKLGCLTHRGEILENSTLGFAGRLSPFPYLHFTFQAFESRSLFSPFSHCLRSYNEMSIICSVHTLTSSRQSQTRFEFAFTIPSSTKF